MVKLFFNISRDLKGAQQLVIAFFTQIKAVAFSIFIGKISPCPVRTEDPFLRTTIDDRDFPAAFVADYFFYFFRFF